MTESSLRIASLMGRNGLNSWISASLAAASLFSPAGLLASEPASAAESSSRKQAAVVQPVHHPGAAA